MQIPVKYGHYGISTIQFQIYLNNLVSNERFKTLLEDIATRLTNTQLRQSNICKFNYVLYNNNHFSDSKY